MKRIKLTEHGAKLFAEGKLTGFANTDATLYSDCPRCFAKAGFECQTPKGRACNTPHGERLSEFIKGGYTPKSIEIKLFGNGPDVSIKVY